MKRQDIQPHQIYAYYSPNQKYGRADRVVFYPQHLNSPTYQKGAIYGLMYHWDFLSRTTKLKREKLQLANIRELYPVYEENERLKLEELKLRAQQRREWEEEGYAKAKTLHSYLKEQRPQLEAAGLPLPQWISEHTCSYGKIQLTFTQEQLEALLSRAGVTA